MCTLIHRIVYGIVFLIGLYMLYTFRAETINPPMLSGIAFMLIGSLGFKPNKK